SFKKSKINFLIITDILIYEKTLLLLSFTSIQEHYISKK
ncbi:hypothetical protein EHRUM3_03490, partial [Ehrlichia ruminantium]